MKEMNCFFLCQSFLFVRIEAAGFHFSLLCFLSPPENFRGAGFFPIAQPCFRVPPRPFARALPPLSPFPPPSPFGRVKHSGGHRFDSGFPGSEMRGPSFPLLFFFFVLEFSDIAFLCVVRKAGRRFPTRARIVFSYSSPRRGEAFLRFPSSFSPGKSSRKAFFSAWWRQDDVRTSTSLCFFPCVLQTRIVFLLSFSFFGKECRFFPTMLRGERRPRLNTSGISAPLSSFLRGESDALFFGAALDEQKKGGTRLPLHGERVSPTLAVPPFSFPFPLWKEMFPEKTLAGLFLSNARDRRVSG